MEPVKPKGLVIASWIVSIIVLIIVTPIMFIAGIFASDGSSGETSTMSYILIFSPLIFIVLPIITQILYSKANYAAARKAGWLSVSLAILLPIAGFAYVFLS
jgi:hypothetical protein